jgi:hypothetical protein
MLEQVLLLVAADGATQPVDQPLAVAMRADGVAQPALALGQTMVAVRQQNKKNLSGLRHSATSIPITASAVMPVGARL